MAFWLFTAFIALIVALVLVLVLLRKSGSEADDEAATDIQVYRDQLKELDRDVARGTILEDEAERARVEISRRLLEADRKARAETGSGAAPRAATIAMAALAALVVIGGGFGLYYELGANRPGQLYPDMGLKARKMAAEELRQTRPSQQEAETRMPAWPGPGADVPADYLELIDKLRKAVADNPGDLQGQSLLATHEVQLGNFVGAYKAQKAVIAAKGDAASDDDFARLADLLVLAAGGYVSPEAETAINEALKRNPNNPVALYYSGLLEAQIGRPDIAFPIWRALLEQSPPGAPWVSPIRSQIGQLAAMAGVEYTPPGAAPPLAGPSAEDMAAAADMTPEERQQMIRGMVERLSNRLATEGGSAQEWAQLIGALATLGDTEQAAAIWAEAQGTFADFPDKLAIVRRAAENAGLTGAPAGTPSADAPSGPSAEDMAAAADMTPEERQQMIRGMVDGLANRLATEGGSAQEWARLVSALGVLGEADRASTIWAEARSTFAGRPAELAAIRAAAVEAGVEAAAEEASRLRALDDEATQLSDKIGNDGGTAEDWARLIAVYGEMGETGLATRRWEDAQARFAPLSPELAMVREAAKAAGVAE